MVRQPLLRELLVTSIVVALLHRAAIAFSWYWTFWWMDILMHFLGGAVIGLGMLWLVFVSGTVPLASIGRIRVIALLAAAGGTLVVGLLWEVFEYYVKILQGEERIVLDTTMDLIMDVIGGVAAYGYAVRRKVLGDGWDA